MSYPEGQLWWTWEPLCQDIEGMLGALRKFVSKSPPLGLHRLSAAVNANHKFDLTEGSGYDHLLNASPPWLIQKYPCPSTMKSTCFKRMWMEGNEARLEVAEWATTLFLL